KLLKFQAPANERPVFRAGLKPAAERGWPQYLPSLHRLRKSLKLAFAKIAILKQVSNEALSALRDDDRIGHGQGLKSGRQIGSFANGAFFRLSAGADNLTGYHGSGGYTNAHLELLAMGIEFGHGIDDGEGGTNGALCIVFMRLRVTEEDKRPITQILSHKP